jgi:outer membrane receptor protein involved in Fe transport
MSDFGVARFRRALLTGVAFSAATLALSLAPAVRAQDTASTGGAAKDDNRVEKVTVTARKRKESLKDAPVTVTPFTPESIDRLNIQSIDDVARFTPGLSFSKTFGRSTDRPVIRGQSNVLANVQFGVESGAAYFIDGMYFGGSIQSIDLGDIERIEVIKGPQSALFGRNTYSGAINFITRRAGEDFGASGSARVGTEGRHEFRASVDLPLGETLGVRIAARDYNYDGEYLNVVNNEIVGSESSQGVSGSIDWVPTDDFSLRGRLAYSQDDDGPLPLFLQSAAFNNCMPGFRSLAFFPSSGSTNNNQYFCGVIKPAQFVNLNTSARTNPVTLVPGVPLTAAAAFIPGGAYNAADGTAFDGIERDLLWSALKGSWDIGGSGYTIEASVAHRREDEKFGSDSDHSGVNTFFASPATGAEPLFANTNRDKIKEYVYELQISTPASKSIRWSGGVFFYDLENKGYDIVFADPTGLSRADDILRVSNKAVFGLFEADLTDTLTATVEGRYASEEKSLTDFNPAGGPIVFDRTSKFHRATPRITLRWKPSEEITAYAIYSEGVKPGGLNGAIGLGVGKPTYAQETSKNQEIGIKTLLFDGAMSANLAAYHIDAKNVQLTTAVPPLAGGGATTSIVTNQGVGETWGTELDFRYYLDENINFGGSYSWTRPKFVSGCDEDQWILTSGGGLLSSAVGTGTGTQQAGFTGNCSIAGKFYPLVPQHQATFAVEYRSDPFDAIGQSWQFFGQGDVSYESSKFVQVHNLAETGSTTLLGARLGIEGENWTLAAYGQNLTDEDTITLATRWFTTPYGFGATPGSTAPAGFSRSSPRGFFGGLRPGQSFGVELKFNY